MIWIIPEIILALAGLVLTKELNVETKISSLLDSPNDATLTFKADIPQHATEYNGECKNDTNCGWLGENSYCKYGRCECQEKHRWYQGNCKAYSGLSERCTADLDCYDGHTWGSMKCLKNICACIDGFQNRGNVDCRKNSKAKGSCALNIDCPAGYTCQNGICNEGTRSSNYKEAHPVTNAPILLRGNLATKCEVDGDCKMINSECYNVTKTCLCKPGYFLYNNTCEAELGIKTCDSDKDCYILQGICQTLGDVKQCRCRDYWFYSKDNRICIKTMQQTNWNCLSNEWCYALGTDSYCSSKNVCECSQIARLNHDNMVCKKDRDSTLCKSNQECSYIKPHNACADEKCACDKNYEDKNGVCISTIGGTCSVSKDCETVEHAICSNKKCVCEDGYIESQSDKTVCLAVAGMGEKCQEDIQCNAKNPRVVCSQARVCDCASPYRYFNDSCQIVGSYQGYCSDTRQCRFDNEELMCRNSKCQCSTTMRFVDEKCVKSTSLNMGPSVILVGCLVIRTLSFVF